MLLAFGQFVIANFFLYIAATHAAGTALIIAFAWLSGALCIASIWIFAIKRAGHAPADRE